MKKRVFVSVLASLLVLSLIFTAGCGSSSSGSGSGSGASSTPFIIGITQPLTGANAEAGTHALNAMKLCVKQINEAGGLNGQMLEIVSYDDESDPATCLSLMTKMATDSSIKAIGGSIISGCVLASLDTIAQYKIPTYCGGLSASLTASGNEYFWRSLINQDFIAVDIVKSIQDMGFKTIAIFGTQDEASMAAALNLRKSVEAMNIDVVAWEEGDAKDISYSAQCASIVASNPECVYMSAVTPMQPVFIKELRQSGYTGLVFSRESYAQNAIDIAGTDASYGIVFSWPNLTYVDLEECKDPFLYSFLEAYQKEYGALPVNDCAYRGYNSLLIMAEAARIAGVNEREAINEATGKISGLQILGGLCDFTDGQHEPLRGGTMYMVIEGGKYQLLDEWIAAGGLNK